MKRKFTKAMNEMLSCTGHCAVVPDEVEAAIGGALESLSYPLERSIMAGPQAFTRDDLANHVGRIMVRNGWPSGFCKCYRHGHTQAHRLVYAMFSTVRANFVIDESETAA